MASLLRPGLSLFQGLQLSLLRWFKGQRGLITGETDIIAVSEFLLQEYDLPPADQDYFKLISQDKPILEKKKYIYIAPDVVVYLIYPLHKL